MLNVVQKSKSIGTEKIAHQSSFRKTLVGNQAKKQMRILLGMGVFFIVFLFLPWTQNTRARGMLIALEPEKRPQTIHSIIAGRIEHWYVREGDFVRKGDTILFLSETQDQFMDPELLRRTRMQIDAKKASVMAYDQKISAMERQADALRRNRVYRMEQADNRIIQARLQVASDSISFEASKINFDIAKRQFERSQKLLEDGLKSLTEVEVRNNAFQREQVNIISSENRLISSRNELLTAMIERNSIDVDFKNQLAKIESDIFTTISNKLETEVEVTKLENQYSNIAVRAGNYYVLAPQDGYLTQAIQVGIGETIERGARIASILPADYSIAAEVYIDPIDLPLVKRGNKVRFIFDGWPAIVFSGWPQVSNGTFGGVVHAIDNFTSANNRYRVLVTPDPECTAWPEPLRIGTGAEGIMLFNDVPVWYEIWRQLNGFPPDFYKQDFIIK
ncbi:MAG: HlyD family efflux transporter periplasmic adaptor subunit [Cryomorphaceae bacterium]|nr:HlyD family efflux transporter periplasmic adaptor subunit [Cryomorphaceae bacterium]